MPIVRTALTTAGITLALAACQPSPATFSQPRPPADAVVVDAVPGHALVVTWAAGGLVCHGQLTVAHPDGTVVYEAAGLPATGEVTLLPTDPGPLHTWARSTPASAGAKCRAPRVTVAARSAR